MKGDFHKVSREEVRNGVLEEMYRFAQKMNRQPIRFLNSRPLDFKPGMSDRLLFQRILNPLIDNIITEGRIKGLYEQDNRTFCALNVLGRYYYPYYGWWDEKELREARCYT